MKSSYKSQECRACYKTKFLYEFNQTDTTCMDCKRKQSPGADKDAVLRRRAIEDRQRRLDERLDNYDY